MAPRRRRSAYPCPGPARPGPGRAKEGPALSSADPVDNDQDGEDAVLLFVGGPLDGRVEIRPARHGEPLPVVTHVHLHDGPKVVHRYDLQPLSRLAGVYHLRPPVRKAARDQSIAD